MRNHARVDVIASFCCGAELPHRAMASGHKAVMLHLLGKQAESASSGSAAAASAAGGLLNLSMTVSVEWARDNIRSNIIATLDATAASYRSDYASYITGSRIGIDEIWCQAPRRPHLLLRVLHRK